MTPGRVTTVYTTCHGSLVQRESITGVLSLHPHHHSMLPTHSVDTAAYRFGKDTEPRNNRTPLGARRQTLTASDTTNPLLSCFLPCQILPVSSRRWQDQSYIECPQGLHGTRQNPALGLLVCARPEWSCGYGTFPLPSVSSRTAH